MINRIYQFAAALTLGFFIISLALVYWQVIRADDLSDRAGNPRVAEAARRADRGAILDRQGRVLAKTVRDADGTARRVYEVPSLAHIVGYASARFGEAGVELSYNRYLSGEAGGDLASRLLTNFGVISPRGNDVVLTIDSDLQEAVSNALGNRVGAAVVLDARSGAILASVSNPSFDANTIEAEGDTLNQDPRRPLLNRAAQGLYPPGSTFKTVTAAAALDSGAVQAGETFTCIGDFVVSGFPIKCGNVPGGEGTHDFVHAYALSINAIFAQVALRLGWDRLTEYASRFGFGSDLGFDIDASVSRVVPPDAVRSNVLLANTGFGQGQLQATPLQMAVVAQTVANGGVAMRPYLVAEIRGPDGAVLERRASHPLGRVMRPQTARTVRDMMLVSTREGFAGPAAPPGISVAGKTGTAENPEGDAHAWYIGFAPADNPVVAVAVVVEHGGSGSAVAAPIARPIFQAALRSRP
jgi:peptidoglycan glycosyltransferase